MMGFSRKGIFSIVIMLLFTLLVGCTGGGSSTYTASGKVIDDKGKALAGVKLIVTGGTSIPDATVKADGTFILSKLTKTCIITPHLEGYVFTPKSATIKAATTKLQFIGAPMIMVSAISVTGTGGATTITADNGTLQMLADVTPANASNKSVTWTVTETDGSATDKATISSTGLLTAVENGTVKVKATSVGTPAVSGTLEITISNQLATSPEGTELTFNTPPYSVPLNISAQSITPYSVASFAEGGKKPYKFSKTSGPEWINVSEAGEISGTPTTAGPNSDLVIRVTDESGAYKEITINVGKTVINPSDRIDVTNVVATSTIEAPVSGEMIVYPTFTITEGSPAHLESAKYWQKKIDGNWVDVTSGKFTEGIWRFQCQVRIDDKVFDGNDGTTHKLASPLKVMVGEDVWLENGIPSIYDTFSYDWVNSPEYEVTNP